MIAFASNKQRRLENYFWRIWGDDGLRRKLPGTTVARIFMQITEDQEIIRTTPVQSPRNERILPSLLHRANKPERRSPPTATKAARPRDGSVVKKRTQVAFEPEGSSTPRNRPNSPSPDKLPTQKTKLPSILKKPRESFHDEASSSSSGNIVTPPMSAVVDEEELSDVAPLVEGPMPPTPPKTNDDGSRVAGKRKKAMFVAGSASSSRRRPGMSRRKSSQSSTSAKTPTPPLQTIHPPDRAPKVVDELQKCNAQTKSKGKAPATGPSPPPIQTRVASAPTADARRSKVDTAAPANGRLKRDGQPWVVDHDFRSRFVDRSQHDKDKLSALLTNPGPSKTKATLASTSTAAMGTVGLGDDPSIIISIKSGKAKMATVSDEVVPLKPEGPSAPPAPTGASSDAPPFVGPLARTKSQLTFLLERDRRHGEAASGEAKQR